LELTFAVAAGTAGGLGTVVIQQAIWPLLRNVSPSSSSMTAQLARSALHTLTGAGLGLLFWLSWGLAAIINVSWWMRGLTFGLLVWSVLVIPALLITRMTARYSWAVLAGVLVEMLSTCALAGIACSWSWLKSP
jgi:hypothetical protein